MSFFLRKSFFLFVAIGLALMPDALLAQQDPVMARAKALMDEAEYAEAQIVISRGLDRKNIGLQLKVEFYWLQGICFISLNNASRAQSSFLKLLALKPSFNPDEHLSPKILSSFLETRDLFIKAGGFDGIYKPRLTPLDDYHGQKTIVARFAIQNIARLGDISRALLYVRKLGNSDYTAIDLSPDVEKKGQYIAVVPSNLFQLSEDPYAVEYYAEALSPSNVRLTGVGTHDLPLSFVVAPAENMISSSPSSNVGGWSYWPYWVGVGAALIGGIVLGTIALTAPQESVVKVVVHQL